MGDVDRIIRLGIDSDLAEASVEEAIRMLSEPGVRDKAKTLIAHPNDAVIAGRVGQIFGLDVVICPVIERDAWQVFGEFNSVYSPGA